jgi:jmjN domain
MASFSRGSTLTPCKSPTPEIPVQPDHFYGTENVQLPPSPDSDGKTWLNPADDPMAHRGIPVFKPTMEEFKDFEGYMNRVECWGSKSGIVKVIPPKEWYALVISLIVVILIVPSSRTASLPPIKPQLSEVKIKSPIEQHMLGNAGLFRQENMEKRKLMSVREWVELCSKDEFRAPGVFDVGLGSRGANIAVKSKTQRKGKQKAAAVMIKQEPLDEPLSSQPAATPPHSEGTPVTTAGSSRRKKTSKEEMPKPKPRAKRAGPTREAREASLADRAARDRDFIEDFSPHQEWLPPNTEPTDYTPEFCQKLERQFWRNCGLGKPAWYGADTQG